MKKIFFMVAMICMSSMIYAKYFNLRPRYFKDHQGRANCFYLKNGRWKPQMPKRHVLLDIPSENLSGNRVKKELIALFNGKGRRWKCKLLKDTTIQNSAEITLDARDEIRVVDRDIFGLVDDRRVEFKETTLFEKDKSFLVTNGVVVNRAGADISFEKNIYLGR